MPGVGVLRRYQVRWLRPDAFAGVAVAAYLVPQVDMPFPTLPVAEEAYLSWVESEGERGEDQKTV